MALVSAYLARTSSESSYEVASTCRCVVLVKGGRFGLIS